MAKTSTNKIKILSTPIKNSDLFSNQSPSRYFSLESLKFWIFQNDIAMLVFSLLWWMLHISNVGHDNMTNC